MSDKSASTDRTALPAAAILRLHNEVRASRKAGVPAVGFLAVEDVQAVLKALSSAEERIVAALECMDESTYGDAEAPFRMRARLTGRAYSDYQSTEDYLQVQA